MTEQQVQRPAWLAARKPGKATLIWAVVVVFFVVVYLSSSSSAGALVYGVASGALVAAIALGVVFTYKGSGVVNFAAGAVAMYVSYVYMDLRNNGKLFIPPLPNPLALVEGIAHASGAKGLNLSIGRLRFRWEVRGLFIRHSSVRLRSQHSSGYFSTS